jgi:ATP-dependent helicase/nuclease subunit A
VSAPADPAPLPPGDARIFAFQRNVVVAASAGTGKTHRLTGLYLMLVLGLTSMGQDAASAAPPVSPDRIVATTFSRDAAQEMSRRIEAALRATAGGAAGEPLPYAEVISARQTALGTMVPEAELRERAALALRRWSSARIDTLHGLAADIALGNALALGLPLDARVLDEDEARSLSELAVDEALGAALTGGGALADAARDLIATSGGVAAARLDMARLFDRLDEEGAAPAELVRADHGVEVLRRAHQLLAVVRAAGDGSPPVRELAGEARRALAAWAAALDGGATLPSLPAEATEAVERLLAVRKPGRGPRCDGDDALFSFVTELEGNTKADKASRLLALLSAGPRLVGREAAMVALLEDARARLARARTRAGGVSFGDVLRAARDALRDHAAVGAAVRAGIEVLLVDEFQDTSRVQRDLVYLLRQRPGLGPQLLDESLAARIEQHGLFLVGDRKQSIYGFRGADVSVFCRVCAELAGREAGVALALPESTWRPLALDPPRADFVTLQESRRSGERVISFVNAFAERDFLGEGGPPRDFEIRYGPGERLHAFEGTAPSGRDDEVVVVDDDGATPEGVEALLQTATGPLREALVAAAFLATRAREQPSLSWRDAAILTRRRSTIPLVELALSRLEVPYVVAGRALFETQEVRDVAAALRLLLDPRDRLAQATVLRGPMVALSDAGLASLSLPQRGLTVPLTSSWLRDGALEGTRGERRGRRVATPAAMLALGPPATLLAARSPAAGPAAHPAPSAAAFPPSGEGSVPPRSGRAQEALRAEARDALARLSREDRACLDAFRTRFAEVRRAALRLPPADAVRTVMEAFDLDRVLAALPRAAARIGNVDRLARIAAQRGGTLAGFVRWLDKRIADETDEAEAAVFSPEDDAVRLTTIHASKGLDFPMVVLLDLAATPRTTVPGLSFLPASAERQATLAVRHFSRSWRGGADPTVDDLLWRAAHPPVQVGTAVMREMREEARRREHAERRRLTYVAFTRARASLVLIAPVDPPRAGSAWATLHGGLEDASLAPLVTRRGSAAALLGAAEAARATPTRRGDAAVEAGAPERPRQPPARTLALATTPLMVFRDCPRRFRLRHLLALDEPVFSGQLDLFGEDKLPIEGEEERITGTAAEEIDPRVLGRAAHRVLEQWPRAGWGETTVPEAVRARLAAEGLAEGAAETERIAAAIARFLSGRWAARGAAQGSRLLREHAFLLPVRAGVATLALRGTMDLCIEHADGSVDVIDYKRSRPRADLGPYAFQLRAYALSARRSGATVVRAGVLFLGGEAGRAATGDEPTPLRGKGEGGAISDAEHDAFERELGALGQRFAEARWNDRFPPVELPTCQRLRCGFVVACHGPAARER